MTVESGNNLGLLTLSAVVLFGGFCGFFLYAIAVSLGNILTELKSTNSLLTRFDTKLIEAEETLEGNDKATAAVEKLASATSERQLDLSRHFSEIKNILENCENILSSVDNRIKGVNSELQKIHTQEMRGILEAIDRVDHLPKRELRTYPCAITACRLIDVPLRLRKLREHLLHLLRDSW